jgi:hypothetical protein
MLLIEDPTVTVKCRIAIKALFLYFNLCLSVNLDNLSCSFTFIYFLYQFLPQNLTKVSHISVDWLMVYGV